MPDFLSRRTLAIFGHPNHEIAVYGTLSRARPTIIYLTDGGGPERVGQTRDALAAIGLEGDAVFLNHTEASFYNALLAGDVEFFLDISKQLEPYLASVKPDQIWCDAIEFYNPVHDVTVPIVRAAMQDHPDIELYEVPLIYQEEAPQESYRIQTVPESLQNNVERIHLTDAELKAKIHARDKTYTLLREQMGEGFRNAPAENFRSELLFASPVDSKPGNGRALRYEWRAEILRDKGEIEEVIRYRDHFVPIASALQS